MLSSPQGWACAAVSSYAALGNLVNSVGCIFSLLLFQGLLLAGVSWADWLDVGFSGSILTEFSSLLPMVRFLPVLGPDSISAAVNE